MRNFQGDSLSPMLFVIVLISFIVIPNSSGPEYNFFKTGPKISDLLHMDYLKGSGKSSLEINTLLNTV